MNSKDIKIDDTVKITIGYRSIVGKVLSAHNYGRNNIDDWYIEIIDNNNNYRYYKQSIDGGIVEKV